MDLTGIDIGDTGVIVGLLAGLIKVLTIWVRKRRIPSQPGTEMVNGQVVLTDGFRQLNQQQVDALMEARKDRRDCEEEKERLLVERDKMVAEVMELRAQIKYMRMEFDTRMKLMQEHIDMLQSELSQMRGE